MIDPVVAHATTLSRHPSVQNQIVHAIEARVSWAANSVLALSYVLKGEITGLRIPRFRSPRRVDGLWQHTCFEVFIALTGQPSYYELNFSPSGEWASYGFQGYRDGGPIEDDGLDPRISVRRTAKGFELDASLRLDRLPLARPSPSLRLGLSAVIEEHDGTLSYWALNHPPGKPDFHHPDCFALELALPGKSA